MDFQLTHGNPNAKLEVTRQWTEEDVLFAAIKMTLPEPAVPQSFRLNWCVPAIDCYSVNSPVDWEMKRIRPNWGKNKTESRLACGMPLHQIISSESKNRLCIAVSDAFKPLNISTGVSEETAELCCYVEFFTKPTTPITEYEAVVRIDQRPIRYEEAIRAAVRWWEEDCGYRPAEVPEEARLPMNSLWYTFHQQLEPQKILEQCRLSAPLGMKTVIIDDGWQTDDNNRGYSYCGDWELATGKIPNMRQLVEEIHATGMKVILWYSVPFIGVYSKIHQRFKDMVLKQTDTHMSLDPRYKEVRDYLIGIYTKAVKDWNLDGLKLDFIDRFALSDYSMQPDPRRDHQCLEEAVDRLMEDVLSALKAVKADIMVEFRQPYAGPAIRKYGHMLRVRDCPNDSICNRFNTVSLRLTSGKTAVHSDMLMWHPQDTPESVANQLAGILFSVPQISVWLDRISAEQRKTLEHYLNFWLEHRELLLDGTLWADHPESLYSRVISERAGKAIAVLYSDPVFENTYDQLILVNITGQQNLILKNSSGKGYRILNCMGEVIAAGTVEGNLSELQVPHGGMLFLQ